MCARAAPSWRNAAWGRALGAGRSFLLDVLADPTIPPLPPQTVDKYARQLEEAAAKGDPEGGEARRGVDQQGG
ncbi:hypothetical protein [Massilia sp. DD77]|uniref:hypothetical protein n=1 Tax=Massilia sp. DD77 TaxID=3109349 RepID=UPI002FFF3393